MEFLSKCLYKLKDIETIKFVSKKDDCTFYELTLDYIKDNNLSNCYAGYCKFTYYPAGGKEELLYNRFISIDFHENEYQNADTFVIRLCEYLGIQEEIPNADNWEITYNGL